MGKEEEMIENIQKQEFHISCIEDIEPEQKEKLVDIDNSVRKTIREDISLCNSSKVLWQLHSDEPDIKQIYGHFLPPLHRNLVEGLIAKDFNFPSAYHAAKNLNKLLELYAKRFELRPECIISLNPSVKLRIEEKGAVVYTQYFNGYYVNQLAYEILKCCEDEISVMDVASKSGYQLNSVKDFLTRILILGLIDASNPQFSS